MDTQFFVMLAIIVMVSFTLSFVVGTLVNRR